MAVPITSGEVDFTQSAGFLIAGALRVLGVIEQSETPGAAEAQTALQVLNSMVTAWQASGIHVWSQEEAILFQNAGQPQYQLGSGSSDKACLFNALSQTTLTTSALSGAMSVMVASAAGIAAGDTFGVQLQNGTNFWTTVSGAPVGTTVNLAAGLTAAAATGAIVFAYDTPLMRPLRIPGARAYLYSSRHQIPMTILSRLDYDYLPNPFNTGSSTQYFYDPQTGNGAYNSGAPIGLFNCWPAPSDNDNGIRFVSQRPLQSFANLANVPDFPPEWGAALRWNLALELAAEYDVYAERLDTIAKRAGYWFGMVSMWDKEPEPILFGVAMQPGYR